MVKTDSGVSWQEIFRLTTNPADVTLDNKVNYQLFMSGLTARWTFLLNVNTGVTWQLTSDDDVLFWTAFE
jgi:hypothetical protein